jgi:bifunctional DNA-binding transcriptional regulator/antitoxin component of YhaV-PrlF toxin-antitoxin module
MTKLVINSKGQITLPEDMLEHLGLQPGKKVIARKLSNERVEIRAAHRMGAITDVFGILKRDGRRSTSIERIDKIAARGWAGRR